MQCNRHLGFERGYLTEFKLKDEVKTLTRSLVVVSTLFFSECEPAPHKHAAFSVRGIFREYRRDRLPKKRRARRVEGSSVGRSLLLARERRENVSGVPGRRLRPGGRYAGVCAR